jgi:hypothetical protein
MPEGFITEQQERPPPMAEHCRIEISLEKSSPYVAFGAVSMATITPVKTHEEITGEYQAWGNLQDNGILPIPSGKCKQPWHF